MSHEQYEWVIGLEIHVQLATASKAFCADAATFGGAPNTHVSAISLGHPGTLPRLNRQQLNYAVRLALALGSQVSLYNTFDRKNYFYADMPKGYQLTQDAQPICRGGRLPMLLPGGIKYVRIHHIHMEEDAGKSIHEEGSDYSLIDLNRAGVPLLEVVTEPDLRSAEEVDACMSAMRQLVRYLGISDGNMQEGSLRCDCNVSVRLRGETRLGTRCEIKNLNSMRFARKAIEFEAARQIAILESGGEIVQQTRHFDPVSGTTSALRDKEDAHDYRYFPDPDLPPVLLSQQEADTLAAALPPLPWVLYDELIRHYGLGEYDARLLTEELEVALFYQEICTHTSHYKAVANLLVNKLLPERAERQWPAGSWPLTAAQLADFIALIEDQKAISASSAYQHLLPALLQQPALSAAALAQQLNLLQTKDEGLLEQLIAQIVHDNPDKVAAYRKGKTGLMGFFMGELMRASQGKAEPTRSKELLEKALR